MEKELTYLKETLNSLYRIEREKNMCGTSCTETAMKVGMCDCYNNVLKRMGKVYEANDAKDDQKATEEKTAKAAIQLDYANWLKSKKYDRKAIQQISEIMAEHSLEQRIIGRLQKYEEAMKTLDGILAGSKHSNLPMYHLEVAQDLVTDWKRNKIN